VERRRQWNFLLGDDGAWAWRVVEPDGTENKSETTFKTLKECTEDATRNGYVAWRTEEERRRRG
jgi:hypothetical protein